MATITFDEYAYGTANPTYTFDDVTVTLTGIVTTDSSQPASPVIAANYSYFGPIFVYFSTGVKSVSVDVGYFDNIGSTRIEFRDVQGNLLQSFHNGAYGVQTFSFSSETGIGSVCAIDESFDDAGFSLDTIVLGDAVEGLAPPEASLASLVMQEERNLGALDESAHVFVDNLGGGDERDVFAFTAEAAGTVTVTTYLASDPSETATRTFAVVKGVNKLMIEPGETYPDSQNYRVRIDVAYDLSVNDRAIDDFINDSFADMFGGVLDFQEFKYELLKVIHENMENADDAVKMLGKIEKAFGIAGKLLNWGNIADNVVHADDWKRQLFVELADAAIGTAASGAVGFGASVVGTPVAGVIGGFATNIVYSTFISDSVRDAAGEMYDDEFSPGERVLSETAGLISAKAADKVVVLDVDYYLDTYADARKAIADGSVSNAMMHYLTVGIGNGYKPNAEDGPVKGKDIALQIKKLDGAGGFSTQLFESAVGTVSGDKLSAAEQAVAEHINGLRTDGSELNVSAELSGIANRIAKDWVLNRSGGIGAAFDPEDPSDWANTLSSGKDFREALATLPDLSLTLGDNVKIVAAFMPGTSAATVYQALSATAESANLLLGTDSASVGVAELGGMWVVIVDTFDNSNDAALQKSDPGLTVVGDEQMNTLYAGASKAVIRGYGGADEIVGGIHADKLSGGEGDDVITGGGGADHLAGGRGSDTFVFVDINDSGTKAAKRETIADFRAGEGDSIDLSSLDASVLADGDQAFKFIGKRGFSDSAGELHYTTSGRDIIVSADVDGDGRADFAILLKGVDKLAADAFIL